MVSLLTHTTPSFHCFCCLWQWKELSRWNHPDRSEGWKFFSLNSTCKVIFGWLVGAHVRWLFKSGPNKWPEQSPSGIQRELVANNGCLGWGEDKSYILKFYWNWILWCDIPVLRMSLVSCGWLWEITCGDNNFGIKIFLVGPSKTELCQNFIGGQTYWRKL